MEPRSSRRAALGESAYAALPEQRIGSCNHGPRAWRMPNTPEREHDGKYKQEDDDAHAGSVSSTIRRRQALCVARRAPGAAPQCTYCAQASRTGGAPTVTATPSIAMFWSSCPPRVPLSTSPRWPDHLGTARAPPPAPPPAEMTSGGQVAMLPARLAIQRRSANTSRSWSISLIS